MNRLPVQAAAHLKLALLRHWPPSEEARNSKPGNHGGATGTIANTGTGTPTAGNYRVDLRDGAGRRWKGGHIEGFPRKRLLAWDLLYRALRKLVGNRNPTPNSRAVCDLLTANTTSQRTEPINDHPTTKPPPNFGLND